MNTKIKYHSVAVRCSELPIVPWAQPADDIFHRWEGGHIWLIDSNDFTLDQIRAFAQKLSYDELDKASRFHFEKDRRQYVLTHGILRDLLGKYYQMNRKVTPNSDSGLDIFFEENEFGKPFVVTPQNFSNHRTISPAGGDRGVGYLQNIKNDSVNSTPQPPLAGESVRGNIRDIEKNIEFNISHSGNMILIGFRFCKNNVTKTNAQIGVDIEMIKPDFDFELVLDEFFTQKEQEVIWKSKSSIDTFFKFWTQKEALVKATGTGLTDDLKYYNLSAQSFRTDEKVNQLQLDENAFAKFLTKEIFIHSFKIENPKSLNGQIYAASIALLDSDTQLEFFRYNKL